jgi:hypothetical protein
MKCIRHGIFFYVFLSLLLVSCQPRYRFIYQEGESKVNTCESLPGAFSEEDLVGKWVAEYFGGLAKDTLIIREDGHYKQTYRSDFKNFDSEWRNWWFEFHKDGYGVLHLEGMRRCDDIDSICDNPGGGLPNEEMAINQCKNEFLPFYTEGILFVVPNENFPREIFLLHPRLAGSDFSYSFKLMK